MDIELLGHVLKENESNHVLYIIDLNIKCYFVLCSAHVLQRLYHTLGITPNKSQQKIS